MGTVNSEQSARSSPVTRENMKDPLSHSASLSTPGLLLGKTREQSRETEKKTSESKEDSGTFTLRSAERKGLIDEDRWLSLDRRGKTSRQKISSDSLETVEQRQEEPVTRAKSRERSQSPDKEADLKKVKSFWVDLDNDTQRKKSQDKSAISREKKISHSRSRSVSRGKSAEPAPDYDDDRIKTSSSTTESKSKSSKIKRGSQVVKKKRDLETPSYN